ncbi:hypothetical protein LOTGIDRAFT_229634 [Lottia gigantea]|uniref:TATA-binding protein-associated factor 172 n=1 Tax=Lottia gigantea TaxID=225164 RepID=V4B6I6_LOTGI|nr:hypothetical protein LOTGIDRAFT_229634 [Lottia gigantea]ESO84154.1 hypothetical protein LOTGIDRAFT_229634 [Lottia gigantea]
MAAVVLNVYPEKLNPVIRPLMDCIKKEDNETIQIEASKCLARLFEYVLDKTPNPTSKIIKNLATYVCCETSSTPLINQPVTTKTAALYIALVPINYLQCISIVDSQSHEVSCDNINGIITLCNLQKVTEIDNLPTDLLHDDTEIQKRGGERALCTICQHFNSELQNKLPDLWNSFYLDNSNFQVFDDEVTSQDLVNSLQVLQVVSPSLHSSILSQVTDKLPQLCLCLQHRYAAVRHMAARCIGVLCQLQLHSTMQFVIENIIPMLSNTDNDIQRQGSIEAMANIIEILGMNILPYIVLLVVPVLGCMCDQNEPVRLMATHCFAQMIRLLPLEAGIPDPPEMKGDLANRRDKERKFLEQLLDGSKSEDYDITVDIKAELRKYQQDGVNWLGFLNKYKLHGILCDDMGLGKTLQSICILATDHYERQKQYQKENTPDCCPLPSLVVCPPTLVGHWVYEINKFVDNDLLNPLMYAGPPSERIRLQKKVKKHNLIVASYDVVRNDIEFFTTFRWNYCILDEGHIIRNGKTKLSKAVKQLLCNHRLILSGTPIQNNVLDLWSLFDFLMPGFLGTEKQFQARYGKPILQSRDGKSTTKEQEAGALAMEALHRQVLPFILRRLKEDVLQDLPPKIIQDYYCDLSPLQVELYEDFAKSQVKNDIEDDVVSEDSSGKKSQGSTHVFQALQYLRKVCNHPSLVLTTSHPKYDMIMSRLKHDKSSIHDIQHAPKLTALKQLLNDCGIGVGSSNTSGTSNILGTDVPVVNQHRVLLFCQLKSMLNIVEQDLIKREMPSVTYLRLDGGVPATSRHDIVQRFNNDPSIDMLLLTTHVGGLGLNLTGADTVIFVEHDWNPMKDLQAMDRAHRIGQKKVVNVYRLVTRGTLEEKIMGLQKFKLNIANTVISQDNSNLQSMATDQLLHLFTLDDMKKGESSVPSTSSDKPVKKESMKTILESLEGLWDEPQYDTEYDLNNFMQSLNK